MNTELKIPYTYTELMIPLNLNMNQFENVKTYTELKIRLDILGCRDYPPECLFDMARSGVEDEDEAFGKWLSMAHWRRFCNVIQERIDRGMCLSSMNSVNCGLFV